MKFNLIGNNDMTNPIETIAKNRDLKHSIDLLTKITRAPEDKVTIPYDYLRNIDKGVECVVELINKATKKPTKILIIVDSDTDGYTSSALMFNYLQRVCPDLVLEYFVHENKASKTHGVFDKDITDDVDLVIVPDAGTNSKDELIKIKKRGIQVLVLDHHMPDDNTVEDYAIIINNQMSPNYPNKELSGVGIVYKFCKALDDELGYELADEYLDLVSLGMIADLMDTREPETRYYMKKGLENITNPFIIELFNKQSYSTKGVASFKTIAWYIAPLINGTVRYGSLEERKDMFEAFIEGNQRTLPYKKRGETTFVEQPIAEAMARICSNIKGRQDTAKRKAVKTLQAQIEENNLLDNKLLIVDATKELEGIKSSLTGLVAMELSDKYKIPTLVVREYKNAEGLPVLGGSGRNFNFSPLENLQETLIDLDKFLFVQGHGNAFGHEFYRDSLEDILDSVNQELSDLEFIEQYTVDFLMTPNTIKKDVFIEIDNLAEEWGQGLEEPYIALTNVSVKRDDISVIGEKKNTVKFVVEGLEVIKFTMTQEEIEDLLNQGELISLDIVGRASVNVWAGKTTPQLQVEDWNYKKDEEIIF